MGNQWGLIAFGRLWDRMSCPYSGWNHIWMQSKSTHPKIPVWFQMLPEALLGAKSCLQVTATRTLGGETIRANPKPQLWRLGAFAFLPEQFKWNLCDDFYENRFPFSLNVFVKHFSSYSLVQRLLLAGVCVTEDQFTSSALGDTISPTLLVLVRASGRHMSSLSPCVIHLSLPSDQSLL